jgi:hypothetical protein
MEQLLESKRPLKVKIHFLFWNFKTTENVELLTAVCANVYCLLSVFFFGRGGGLGNLRVGSLSSKSHHTGLLPVQDVVTYRYLSTAQIKLFRPSPSHTATGGVRLSHFA